MAFVNPYLYALIDLKTRVRNLCKAITL